MKPTVKDLINVGIFTVLYMVIVVICGQLGALLPITQVLGPLYIPLLAGIVFMLFLTRVRHFGLVTIMGLLVGLVVLATGQSYWVLILAVVFASLGDFIMSLGRYKKWLTLVIGYVCFSFLLLGTVVPLFFLRDSYLGRLSERKDDAWMSGIVAMTPWWMFLVMIAMIMVGASLGAFLGRAMLRKHFEKAGIA